MGQHTVLSQHQSILAVAGGGLAHLRDRLVAVERVEQRLLDVLPELEPPRGRPGLHAAEEVIRDVDRRTHKSILAVKRPGRLHALTGDRKGPHAMTVNHRWRITFRFADSDAHEVAIEDYRAAAPGISSE